MKRKVKKSNPIAKALKTKKGGPMKDRRGKLIKRAEKYDERG